MARITRKGRDLSWEMVRRGDYGMSPGIAEACSLICRHATTYARLAEMVCSVEMTAEQESRTELQQETIERRIADLAVSLPPFDDGARWTVRFDGDPRGWTVRLVRPDGSEVGVA